MALLSSFEIMAQTLVPDGILPPGAPNPFLLQGYFVQVSIAPEAPVSSVQFNIIFQETTDFKQGVGQTALQAQIIDAKGSVSLYKQFFASTGRGFLGQQISVGQTLIYGVQCIPGLAGSSIAAARQNGTGWRGTVQISNSGGNLIATPTHRLLYYTDASQAQALDAGVYAVPTFNGSTQI